MISNSSRSRTLSYHQLFDILQQEYIVCEIRIAIYPEVVKNKNGQEIRLKDYWRQTAEKKKEKILDISKRNSFSSIFDDRRIKQIYNSKIVPDIGYPNFLYKDAIQQLMQEKWDLHNYYSEFTDVKVLNKDRNVIFGHICKVNFTQRCADIKYRDKDEVQSFELDVVTRILTL